MNLLTIKLFGVVVCRELDDLCHLPVGRLDRIRCATCGPRGTAVLVATGDGWRCLAFVTGTPRWLFVGSRRSVGALRNRLSRPGWWGCWLCGGGRALDGGLRAWIRAASTIAGLVFGRAATVRRRGALLGLFTMLLVVVGGRDCGRDGHDHLGSQNGGACSGADGHVLGASGGCFGSG
jgi:hypothetical protein